MTFLTGTRVVVKKAPNFDFLNVFVYPSNADWKNSFGESGSCFSTFRKFLTKLYFKARSHCRHRTVLMEYSLRMEPRVNVILSLLWNRVARILRRWRNEWFLGAGGEREHHRFDRSCSSREQGRRRPERFRLTLHVNNNSINSFQHAKNKNDFKFKGASSPITKKIKERRISLWWLVKFHLA